MNAMQFNQGATAYCEAFAQDSTALIKNAATTVKTIETEGLIFPISINDGQWHNSYVCSPYTALHGYCLEELYKVQNKALRVMARPLIRGMGGYMKSASINKNVHINNWLLSTNLYPPDFTGRSLAKLTNDLTTSYPDHALIFRSLNPFSNSNLLREFENADYLIMPSRQLYVYDQSLGEITKRNNYRNDVRLLKRDDYQYVTQDQFGDADLDRVVQLYNYLYIAKYSKFNPMFTRRFIEHVIQNPLFELYGFRNPSGHLDAVGGRFSVAGTTTLPIVGYDTGLPNKLGLYRRILIASNIYALKNGLTFNASSGASHFKMLRGAVPQIEYSAVYVAHLPVNRRRCWKLLAGLLNKIGVPIIKKYQL